jgi:hypothetical protein
LIVDWKLPEDFESVVSQHHKTRSQDGTWGMAELVSISCRMADTIGFAAFPGCEITPYQELLEELPSRERRLFHADLDSLAQEITHSIGAVESA